MKLALSLLIVLTACSDHKAPEPKRDPERPRRVIEPPSRGVRALPPYAIRADGVGPYKLGATVATLLDQLPSGPRITQFALPGVIQRDVLRAEDNAILIGAEPQGRATFVGVVRPEIARTEAGIHVGSTRAELERVLGPSVEDPDRAQDPHVVVPTGLKNARILLDDDRIAALVVASEPERAKEAAADSGCTRPAGDRDQHTFGICFSPNGELAAYDPATDEISLMTRDGERLVAPKLPVPGLVYAAALRNPADGRDDLVVISKTEDAQTKAWSLTAYRLSHEGKLVPVTKSQPPGVYQLTAANARWIGADLKDLDLNLELTSRTDSIEVGGLLTTRAGDKIRDIVVITSINVPRRPAKPVPHEPSDAGTYDAASASERAAH